MVTRDYFFDGHLRWDLFFINPNHAGAFLAVLLVLAVCSHSLLPRNGKAVYIRYLFFLSEIVTFFLLAKTYCRAALLAVIIGSSLHFLLRTVRYPNLNFDTNWVYFARIFITLSILFGTGFIKRATYSYVSQDRSVLNRFEVWEGGLKLLAGSPLKGWGYNQSGAAYSNWHQPSKDTNNHRDLYNTYLTLSAELGWPFLFFFSFVSIAVVLLPLFFHRKSGENDMIENICCIISAALLTLIIGTSFNSMNHVGALVVMFTSLVLLSLGLIIWKRRFIRKRAWIALTILASSTATFSVFGAGYILVNSDPILVKKSSGTVFLIKTDEPSENILAILSDTDVFGRYPGRFLREILKGQSCSTIIATEKIDNLKEHNPSKIIAFGATHFQIDNSIKAQLVYFHPLGFPKPMKKVPDLLVLPEIDNYGFNEAWRTFAHTNGISTVLNEGVGNDTRWNPRIAASLIQNSPLTVTN